MTLLAAPAALQSQDSAPPQYRRFFARTSPRPGFLEQVGRLIGWTSAPYQKSYALIAGIWSYKFDRLQMAEADVKRLVSTLSHYEGFDEIVVLTNGDFNDENLRFFLQSYFPSRLARNRPARFLFAFSGHGVTRQVGGSQQGYLLLSNATGFDDFKNAVPVRNLLGYADQVGDAHHTLFLLNSCFSGLAVETAGKPRFDTSESLHDMLSTPAFHLLTAGAAGEKVLGASEWGGSLFFSAVLEALEHGDRDRNNAISFEELDGYVTNAVINESGGRQHPQRANRTRLLHPETSRAGSFVFFNKGQNIRAGIVKPLPPAVEYGGELPVASEPPETAPVPVPSIPSLCGDPDLDSLAVTVRRVTAEQLIVSPETSIDVRAPVARYGADDLDLIELVLAIEEATGVAIGDSDLPDNLAAGTSVCTLTRAVARRM